MSRKKRASLSHHRHQHKTRRRRHDILQAEEGQGTKKKRRGTEKEDDTKSSRFTLFFFLLWCLCWEVVTDLVTGVLAMIVGGGGGEGGGGSVNSNNNTETMSTEKKRARLLNKQNKMLAMYRLIKGSGGGDQRNEEEEGNGGGSVAKRMRLDGGGGGADSSSTGGRLDDEAFKAMKQALKERKKAMSLLPRFSLVWPAGEQASVFLQEYAKRTPLLFSDIHHLITYAYGGNDLVPPPARWCKIEKVNRILQVVVLCVDGVGLSEFVDNEECFSRTMGIFGGSEQEEEWPKSKNRGIVEFLSPHWYGLTVEEEVTAWTILRDKEDQGEGSGGGRNNTQGTVNSGDAPPPPPHRPISRREFLTVLRQLAGVFPIREVVKTEEEDVSSSGGGDEVESIDHQPSHHQLPEGDKFSRTDLVLTLPQLLQESYPLPIPANVLCRGIGVHFQPTSESYAPLNSASPMFSFDCEMVATERDQNALASIGLVDEDLNVVYRTLVKPEGGKVTDFRTRWSGITPNMLEGVEVTLADVQRRLKEIVAQFPDCIFIGQSLNCDLKAIRMTHPYVIDTSVVFNLRGVEGRKSSLKDLALSLIDEKIQENKQYFSRPGVRLPPGHDPVEDAGAAMKLVKAKLSKGFWFGNALKNAAVISQNTVISLDPAFARAPGLRSNKLDKSVLLVAQRDEEDEETKKSRDTLSNTPSLQKRKSITVKEATTNGSVVKLIRAHLFEHSMAVGFYRMGDAAVNERSPEDRAKTLGKLDKRVGKLFSGLGPNSLFVVVCSKAENDEGKDDDDDDSGQEIKRRNNGVCFIRVKVPEPVKRTAVRRD